MLQHLLLILVAAPLLVACGALRTIEGPWAPRVFESPTNAWILFVAVFLFWHWPAAFKWSAGSEASRLLEHGSILLASLLFWRIAFSARSDNSLNYGARALYVVTAAIVTDLPGVIMVFSPQTICAMPHENALRYGLTPLQDQELAGLLMWVPANLVFFSIAMCLLGCWLSQPKRLSSEPSPEGVFPA